MSQAVTIPDLQQADFLTVAQALLPPGDAWPRDEFAELTTLLNGCVGSLSRLHAAAAQLSEVEAQPYLSVALLPAWEAEYGLPDPCTPLGATTPQRQAAVKAAMAATGGQSAAYFTGVAAALGYDITIETFQPAFFGSALFGTPFYPANIVFTWQVNVANIAAFPSVFGISHFGDPFVAYSGAQLSCVLNRLKPAHTILVMNYL